MREFDKYIEYGCALDNDCELLDSIGEGATPSHVLVREEFSRRWGVTLNTESSSSRSAWERFLEWCRGIINLFMDLLSHVIGDGVTLKRRQVSVLNHYEAIRERLITEASEPVDATPYSKHFIINGEYSPRACRSIIGHIPKDYSGAINWATKGISESITIIKMASTESRRFDTIADFNMNNSVAKRDIEFIARVGTRTSRTFPRISMGKNTDEEQIVWALPGNAYIQEFSYNYLGNPDTRVKGLRYYQPTMDGVRDSTLNRVEPPIPVERIYTHIKQCEELANTLISMERNNRKIEKELDGLRRAVDEAIKSGADGAKSFVHKVARESLLSSSVSVRALSRTIKTLGYGTLDRAKAHIAAHAKANMVRS